MRVAVALGLTGLSLVWLSAYLLVKDQDRNALHEDARKYRLRQLMQDPDGHATGWSE